MTHNEFKIQLESLEEFSLMLKATKQSKLSLLSILSTPKDNDMLFRTKESLNDEIAKCDRDLAIQKFGYNEVLKNLKTYGE